MAFFFYYLKSYPLNWVLRWILKGMVVFGLAFSLGWGELCALSFFFLFLSKLIFFVLTLFSQQLLYPSCVLSFASLFPIIRGGNVVMIKILVPLSCFVLSVFDK